MDTMRGLVDSLRSSAERSTHGISGHQDEDDSGVHEVAVTVCHVNLVETKQKLKYFYDEMSKKPIPGFPNTYSIQHCATQERRAIKVLSKKRVPADFFWAEVKAYHELYHPNVLHLYETLEDKDHWYLVKDRVDLPNLYQAIPKLFSNPHEFDETQVAVVMRTLLKTLAYCHDKDVVHSNLTYENVLLDPAKKRLRTLQIVGFGYARLDREYRNYHHRSTRSSIGLGGDDDDSDDNDTSSSFRSSTSSASSSSSSSSSRHGVDKDDWFAAPETRMGDLSYFGKAGDLWSVGILCYQLLTRRHPFEDPNVWPINFRNDEWKQDHFDTAPFLKPLSSDARDFMKQLLEYDYEQRPTAQQALAHAYLTKADRVGKQFNTQQLMGALDNLETFHANNKLAKAARMYIVSNLLGSQDRSNLDAIFRYIDRNKNNVITREELLKAFSDTHNSAGKCIKTEAMLQKTFDRLDVKKTGVIEYSEFLAAAADDSVVLTRENLWATFDAFDKSQTGRITVDDLKKVFNHGRKQKVFHKRDAKRLMAQFDKNGDGELNFDEFCEIMGCD
ncbi:Calcium-dependent protein kinase [Seminavis robusta]|uniref:Calcium-dependent protein kinase n=1 Tax=Seminavis robusta TaxID=568900 RepID=A0A9N8H344_9STRA|nr:Calcium-dependent protein kinase [Seminavis robusta]|eukprot:Sro20_g013890.1 Calcium-dependent protein kinase (558) ;mRNA; r:30256-32032